MTTSPPIVDGTYELIGPIGAGGMGEVYEARHRVTGRHVALKLLRAENAAKEDARRRFVREAQAIGRLEHPHVVEILDAGVDATSGAPFLVQTLLRGVSLRKFVRARPRMDPALALRLLAPVLRGLSAAHAAGIVHRDMKPTNVILSRREGDPEGEVVPKIIDFGISKLHEQPDTPEPVSTITQSGVVVGTAAYMAPEQAEGRDDVDGRADIWAVGVMLYEMIVGRRPFEAPSTAILLLRIISHDPVPVADARPGVPPAIAEVVMRALRRDPAARWQTAAAMHAAFEEALGAPLRSAAVTVDGLDEVLAIPDEPVSPREPTPASRAPTAETLPARAAIASTSALAAPQEPGAPLAPTRGIVLGAIVTAAVAAGAWFLGPWAAVPAPTSAPSVTSVPADAATTDAAVAPEPASELLAADAGQSSSSIVPAAPNTVEPVPPRVDPPGRRRRDAGAAAVSLPPPATSEVPVGARGAPILGAD